MSIVELVLPPRETPVKPRVAPTCCQLAAPVAVTLGSRAAPAMRTWASAWRIRAIAAAMSKFCARACSISAVSSGELKPRHQSSDGPGFRLGRLGGAELHRHLHLRPLVVGTEVAAAEQQRERQGAARQQANHRDAMGCACRPPRLYHAARNAAQSCHCQGLVTPVCREARAGAASSVRASAPAAARIRCASFQCGRSIILPSSANTPASGLAVKAAFTRSAQRTCSGEGREGGVHDVDLRRVDQDLAGEAVRRRRFGFAPQAGGVAVVGIGRVDRRHAERAGRHQHLGARQDDRRRVAAVRMPRADAQVGRQVLGTEADRQQARRDAGVVAQARTPNRRSRSRSRRTPMLPIGAPAAASSASRWWSSVAEVVRPAAFRQHDAPPAAPARRRPGRPGTTACRAG